MGQADYYFYSLFIFITSPPICLLAYKRRRWLQLLCKLSPVSPCKRRERQLQGHFAGS